ncbi:unnamed protein product [Caenorhabditis auriculariae]|uniref:MOSC domain-containing protein n=1 Tax=Caenorhabditis auriculariae TaxID=2777116 RepID=A0A8S1H6Y9_9PELO|nr:unnamed protein product [Caenorhabditis auriculariae]
MPYLDHAGASLPSDEQMAEVAKLYSDSRLANPHSHHQSAVRTKQIVDCARLRVLRNFNTESSAYYVVFTANTSHSLKIVAENFSFRSTGGKDKEIQDHLVTDASQFAYFQDSHHSIVGLREIVREKVDSIACLPDDYPNENEIPSTSKSLFVMTAASNFCGRKYPLDWIERFQKKGWSVCIDAASWVSTSPLDLNRYKPNFVAFSFYKIFGYPTGLGALLIRKDGESRFEEGTFNYYAIAALQKGFDDIEKCGGMKKIQDHAYHIAKYAYRMLESKSHYNGEKVVEFYLRNNKFGPKHEQGPLISFNLKTSAGRYHGYKTVEKISAIFGIELRTGCFCNIGACRKYLNLAPEIVRYNQMKGKKCGDDMDLINGKPTGALRVSFGRRSTLECVKALETMIDLCFVESTIAKYSAPALPIESYRPTLVKIVSFPVKSVMGIEYERCELTPRGLMFDREFMIVQNDYTLSLKSHPQLCRLNTNISSEYLEIRVRGEDEKFRIPMDILEMNGNDNIVCETAVKTIDYGDDVGEWLDDSLDLSGCRLMRRAEVTERNLVNDSPFLMVNESSMLLLQQATGLEIEELIKRFRSNFVIRGLPPLVEDSMKSVKSLCTRCEMICINPENGAKEKELLLALRELRESSKMTFGIYLAQRNHQPGDFVEVGSDVTVSTTS